MKLALSLFLFLGIHQQALATTGAESHGGQVVVCPGKEPVLLDYYQATLPTELDGAPDLVNIEKMNSDQVLALIKSRIPTGGQLAGEYDYAVNLLGPIDTWLEGSLQSVSDSDPAYTLPPNCSLQQVAIRQDSAMYVDPTVLKLLSPAQQGILLAHESLFYVASQDNNLDSSVEVRMVIRNLLMKTVDPVALSKSVHEMGSDLYWWEDFSNDVFTSWSTPKKAIFLGYDPLQDGDHIRFTVVLYGAQSNTGFSGEFACAQGDLSTCTTISGPHSCTLKNFFRYVIGSTDANELELSCSDLGLDLVGTTRPDLPPIPMPTQSPLPIQ